MVQGVLHLPKKDLPLARGMHTTRSRRPSPWIFIARPHVAPIDLPWISRQVPTSSRAAYAIFLFLIAAIVLSLALFYVDASRKFGQRSNAGADLAIEALEMFCTILFTVELVLRTIIATIDPLNMLLKEPFWWFDLLSIVPFYAELALGDLSQADGDRNGFGMQSFVRALKFFRMMRVIKLMRHYPGWRVLIMAVQNSWRAILVPAFAMSLTILILSALLFIVESEFISLEVDKQRPLRNASVTDMEPAEDYETQDIEICVWIIFWLVTTLGYDGDMGSMSAPSQLIIAAALISGLLFTTMPCVLTRRSPALCTVAPTCSPRVPRGSRGAWSDSAVDRLSSPNRITIIGDAFAAAWEKKLVVEVAMRVQLKLVTNNMSLHDIQLVFAEFDSDGSGELHWEEFRSAMDLLSVTLPPVEMRRLFKLFDSDHSGTISHTEFCELLFPTLNWATDKESAEGPDAVALPDSCRRVGSVMASGMPDSCGRRQVGRAAERDGRHGGLLATHRWRSGRNRIRAVAPAAATHGGAAAADVKTSPQTRKSPTGAAAADVKTSPQARRSLKATATSDEQDESVRLAVKQQEARAEVSGPTAYMAHSVRVRHPYVFRWTGDVTLGLAEGKAPRPMEEGGGAFLPAHPREARRVGNATARCAQ